MKKFPDIPFIFACGSDKKQIKPHKNDITNYSPSDLINNIYPKCFLCLRLTEHDGLAATVQETGLLGIKSIHNGASPSTLNYKSVDDIYSIVSQEREKIGTIDSEIANKVKEYLTINKNIFNINYYKNSKRYLWIYDGNISKYSKFIDYKHIHDLDINVFSNYDVIFIDKTVNRVSNFDTCGTKICYECDNTSLMKYYSLPYVKYIVANSSK